MVFNSSPSKLWHHRLKAGWSYLNAPLTNHSVLVHLAASSMVASRRPRLLRAEMLALCAGLNASISALLPICWLSNEKAHRRFEPTWHLTARNIVLWPFTKKKMKGLQIQSIERLVTRHAKDSWSRVIDFEIDDGNECLNCLVSYLTFRLGLDIAAL